MNLDTLGQESLATPLPSAGENGATALRLHPSAEAKLALPSALAGLVSAFHKRAAFCVLGKEAPL